jgi:hypothetical protein
MSEKKTIKRLKEIKENHYFIPEYVENYTLIHTGNHDDMNNYDLKLKDNNNNELTIRKTLRGDQSIDALVILKTNQQKYIYQKKIFTNETDPLKIYCLKSEKSWKFIFNGKVLTTNNKTINMSFKINFTSSEPIEDLVRNLGRKSLIKQNLKHKVDRKMIKDEQMTQIVAYQQKGNVEGEIKLDDQLITFNTTGIRHHKFGKMAYQSLFKVLQLSV